MPLSVLNSASNMALMFQYGSNCSAERLNGPTRLGGVARVAGIAQAVEDYTLTFVQVKRCRACFMKFQVILFADEGRIEERFSNRSMCLHRFPSSALNTSCAQPGIVKRRAWLWN